MKTIELSLSATYETYGSLSENTETIVFTFHGYGQLAKYFIRRFNILNSETAYVVAPQGLSKFYLPGHKRVGASWMTKEDREIDLQNQLHYIQTVFEAETKNVNWEKTKLIVLGFSQGVATASRWLNKHQIPFDTFIAYSGMLGHELTTNDFKFAKADAKVFGFLGDDDEFYNGENAAKFQQAFLDVFPDGNFQMFEGKHVIKMEVLEELFTV
jgi:predicted esterase